MMYKKLLFFFLIIQFIVFLSFLFYSSKPVNDKDADYKKTFYNNYRIFSIEVPEYIDFAGEKIKTNRFDIRESIEKEMLVNTYWQSQTLLLIKRANRYFPIVEPILKKYNIPDDFKYLALSESGLVNNIVSPAGAAGVWQFLKATAIQYGLEVNENVDERYHIEKSTEAACKYLLDAYKIYKSWTLVAASYNMGMGALNKQIAHQNANNYYDLFLNTETARYVYRIISLKLIVKDPKSVGFYIRKKDLYPAIPSFTVEVDSSITNLAKFASGYNINYKILKEFNLWIRKSTFINLAKKKYTITIPNIVNYDSLQLSVSDEPIVLPDTLK